MPIGRERMPPPAIARRQAGRSGGTLAGLPISIKESVRRCRARRPGQDRLCCVTRCRPKEDAAIVARLRAAGAIIVGKTNMTEFAFSGLGLNAALRHAAQSLRSVRPVAFPGGSSSGAGVSVTDGMGPRRRSGHRYWGLGAHPGRRLTGVGRHSSRRKRRVALGRRLSALAEPRSQSEPLAAEAWPAVRLLDLRLLGRRDAGDSRWGAAGERVCGWRRAQAFTCSTICDRRETVARAFAQALRTGCRRGGCHHHARRSPFRRGSRPCRHQPPGRHSSAMRPMRSMPSGWRGAAPNTIRRVFGAHPAQSRDHRGGIRGSARRAPAT